MNIIKLIPLFLLLFLTEVSFAQKSDDKKQFKENLDEIIKTKLVDSLGMNEVTADKFLNVYNENNREIRALSKEKREIMKSIEQDPSAIDVGSKFNNMLDMETQIIDKKKKLFTELQTFMTPQQIAKSFILRKQMRKEIRKEFKKHKKGNKKRYKD